MKGRAMRNFDFLFQYGDPVFFRRMIEEGFTEVACGCSQQYQGRVRIAAIFAFYKPDGALRETDFVQVPTWQVVKEYVPCAGEINYELPREIRYSEVALAAFLQVRGAVLGARIDLAGVICAMETQALEESLASPA